MNSKKSCLFLLVFCTFISINSSQKCPSDGTCQKNPNSDEKIIRIAILLPSEKTMKHEFHPTSIEHFNKLERVLPGIEVLGSHNAGKYQSPLQSILPGWKIEVLTGDTQCSPTFGLLEALRLQCQAGQISFQKRKKNGSKVYMNTSNLQSFFVNSKLFDWNLQAGNLIKHHLFAQNYEKGPF